MGCRHSPDAFSVYAYRVKIVCVTYVHLPYFNILLIAQAAIEQTRASNSIGNQWCLIRPEDLLIEYVTTILVFFSLWISTAYLPIDIKSFMGNFIVVFMNGQYWYRSINTEILSFITFKQVIYTQHGLNTAATMVCQQSLKCKMLCVLCFKISHNLLSGMVQTYYHLYQAQLITNTIQLFLHFHGFYNSFYHNITSYNLQTLCFICISF